MIQTINAALSRIEEITPELKKYFFTLEKPLGFTPGQFVTIRFKDNPLTRSFSIASIPGAEELELAIKTEGEFTQRLEKAGIGTEFILKGPLGSFTAKPEMKKICFLAGGIGYTPFKSIIFSEAKQKSQRQLCLIYSARTHKEICDKAAFEHLAKSYNRFKFVKCVTREPEFHELATYNKRIDKEIIKTELPEYKDWFFFICGKKEMIGQMTALLGSIGVDAEHIKIEKWN